MIKLACPNCGHGDALGTVETLIAVAYLDELSLDADGNPQAEYAGESKVIWDTQTWDGKQVSCFGCNNDYDVGELIPQVSG